MNDIFDKHEYVIGQACGGRLDGICLDYHGDIELTIVDLAAALRAERERVEELERLDKERLKWRESYLYEHENHVRLTMRNRENADLYNMTLAKLNAAQKEETHIEESLGPRCQNCRQDITWSGGSCRLGCAWFAGDGVVRCTFFEPKEET